MPIVAVTKSKTATLLFIRSTYTRTYTSTSTRTRLGVAEKQARLPLSHILDSVLVAARHVKHALAVHRERGPVDGHLDCAGDHPENLLLCVCVRWYSII